MNAEFKINAQQVDCFVRNTPLGNGESIYDSFALKENNLVKEIKEVDFYKRFKKDCPYLRDNWIIDIHFKNGKIICIKLPIDTKEQEIVEYLKQLKYDLSEDKL